MSEIPSLSGVTSRVVLGQLAWASLAGGLFICALWIACRTMPRLLSPLTEGNAVVAGLFEVCSRPRVVRAGAPPRASRRPCRDGLPAAVGESASTGATVPFQADSAP